MADLETKFRRLESVRGPDLWPDIETRERRPLPEGGAGRRLAAGAVALVLAAAGAVLVARAFLGDDRSVERPVRPAESPPAPVDPVVDVTLPIRFPVSITYGAGSVWVVEMANDGTESGTIHRIDPDTAETQAQIPVRTVPGWETGGGALEVADGDLWVAGGGSSANLVRIDAATNLVVDNIHVAAQFLGDVAVDERGVWVSAFVRDRDGEGDAIDLVRLDPETGSEEARFPMESSYAREVLAVDGTIWLHERLTHGSTVGGSVLTRLDPETGRVLASVRLPVAPWMVAEGDGFIWAPIYDDEGNVLARLDPRTNELATFPAENLEFQIAVGEGGIWGVARRGEDLFGPRAGIVRWEPVSGRIDASVPIDGSPIALAVAPGSVWVIHYTEGATRIELRPA
ncbi:MAG TPA: hypothetical protein VE915_03295 [Actinomycetota bacterium]|nr:hypothetical protein [Actinomycetota bacterium]